MPCPDPHCRNGFVVRWVPGPDGRMRPEQQPCLECMGSIASCCDGAGAGQPDNFTISGTDGAFAGGDEGLDPRVIERVLNEDNLP